MYSTELRIGNLVYRKKTVIEVDIVILSSICTLENQNIELYKPIPITEEWLQKFGFVRLGNQETWFGRALWNKGVFAIMHGYGTTNGQRTRYNTTEFDYIHQLQNLYFALIGEELK